MREILFRVLDWIENNRAVIKALERLLGDVRKAEKTQIIESIRLDQQREETDYAP